jgi:hypothetical protein
MVGIDRLRLRLRLLARSEQGMALPFALLAMIAATALASAAVISSVNVQQGSHRDSASKSAIAAADAGASVALQRLNRYASALNNAATTNCLGVSAGGTLVVTGAVNGWCPPIQGTVGSSTYSYRVSAMFAGSTMYIVSTGTANGVSRRVDVAVSAESIDEILKEEGLIGKDKIKIPGNPHIRVSVGTNGEIDTAGKSWEICGNARHGVGKEGPSPEELSCGGEEVEREVNLPPVSSFIPPEIANANVNDNRRLVRCVSKGVPAKCETDYYDRKRTATSPYNPSTRRLNLSGGALTMAGEDYWLCQLTLSGNSQLIMFSGVHVRIFFDTPEHCGLSSSDPQISVTGSSNVEATGYEPELGIFDMFEFYLLGGPTSSVVLHGNTGSNQVMIYGPDSDITVDGNATYKGVIVGRTLDIAGDATFEQDAGYEPQKIGSATLYSRQSYVECSGVATSAPNENC